MRVLLVEDVRYLRTLLRRIMEEASIEVIGEATDGEQAVKLFAILKPDVVVMDINLPRKNGITAIQEICILDPKARIIVTSVRGHNSMVKKALFSGAIDFIVKPVDKERLLTSLALISGLLKQV